MALISVSRPADQSLAAMATPSPVNLSSKKSKKCIACGKSPCECENMHKGKKVKAAYEWEDVNAPDRGMNGKQKPVKNKGKRFRVSDTSGNVTAGGEGSGRRPSGIQVTNRDAMKDSISKNATKTHVNKRLNPKCDWCGNRPSNSTRYETNGGGLICQNCFSKETSSMEAGGMGSGRKKEVEQFLKSKGFEQHKVYGTRNGDDKQGGSHWIKTIDKNIHGTHDSTGSVSHHVRVASDGSWMHSVSGGHHGMAEDIGHIHLAAANGVEGQSLEALKTILARSFSQKTRKKLAKTGAAEPDGSYPIKNKKDYENAVKDLNRTGRKPSDVAHVNKRAKQLGLKSDAMGPGLTAKKKKKLKSDGTMPSKNEDAIEYYSSVGFKCANGTLKIHAGGPGSGRHITVTTGNNNERIKVHRVLQDKGFKVAYKDFKKDGSRTHEYTHNNGDSVTMHYKPSLSGGGEGSGRKAGMALGKMLRKALMKRMEDAINIAQRDYRKSNPI